MNEDRTQLDSEELLLSEIPGYMELVEAAEKNVLTTEKIQIGIRLLKSKVEDELSEFKETPQAWLSLISLFIPFYGLIRKWYQDQKRMYLQARLKNLNLILLIFTNQKEVQRKLEEQMASLKKNNNKYLNEAKWMKGGDRLKGL